MKWPLITRKNFDKILEQKERAYKYSLQREREEREALMEPVARLLDKFTVVRIAPHPKGYKFRIAVDYDTDLVQRMVHGNDQHLIHEISKMMGRRVEQEMRTLNFARFENIPW